MSQEKICPTCGTEYPANERFCPRDGTALRSQTGNADLVGSIIAERYHVLKKLGEGGMGQVYLAEHVKMGRKSAVKVMNPGMVNDADAISRFNREAANASRINHPNVAGIYDFGETAEGLIYLAMEFIEGESLTSLVEKSGALAPARAANIAQQAAAGLQVAHDMGIVHRDLKPDNIMIAKNRDGSDCVKVVDFGIAKAAGAENQKVTKTGLVVGTPEYMSPEQLAGDKLDGRSDVYSLALVAFNMFTGALPFPSETAQESMIMRLTDEPKSLAEMKPDTIWPPAVQSVMRRALKRRASERYQKAEDFGNALSDAVGRMPRNSAVDVGTTLIDAETVVLQPTPPTRVDPSAPPARAAAPAMLLAPVKSKTPAIVGGSVAAAVAAVAVFVIMSRGGATPPAKRDSTSVVPPVVAGAPVSPAATPGGGTPPAQTRTQGPVMQGAQTMAKPIPTPPPVAAAVDIGARIPDLLRESAEDATAAKALREAEALAPKAIGSNEIVGLSVVRARALGWLGRDKESCDILNTIKEHAASTKYDEDVQRMLKLSC